MIALQINNLSSIGKFSSLEIVPLKRPQFEKMTYIRLKDNKVFFHEVSYLTEAFNKVNLDLFNLSARVSTQTVCKRLNNSQL